MAQAQQLDTQWQPQAYVRIEISVKLNGSEVNSSSRVQLYNAFGVDPADLAADIFDLFSVSDDGTDIITTEITLTALADIVPWRIEWNYDEETIAVPGSFNNITETWDFNGTSDTRTFSASVTDRKSIKGFQNFTITDFIFPT